MDHVTRWHTSSYSGNHNCVEVGRVGDRTAVRDTKNRESGHFTATTTQWFGFITAIKTGRYDD